MAKISYTKLKKKIEPEIQIIDFNGEKIEMRKWIPTQEELALMGRVIEFAHDENYHYMNPIHLEAYLTIEMIKAYTNISFTEKQEEDIAKLYDEIAHGGLLDALSEQGQFDTIYDLMLWNIKEVARYFYEYQRSFAASFESMSQEYEGIEDEITGIQSAIQNPENLTLLKDIMNKLG